MMEDRGWLSRCIRKAIFHPPSSILSPFRVTLSDQTSLLFLKRPLLWSPQIFDVQLQRAAAVPLVRLKRVGDINLKPGMLLEVFQEVAEPERDRVVGRAAVPVIQPQLEMLAV